jgi:hypothetical protein
MIGELSAIPAYRHAVAALAVILLLTPSPSAQQPPLDEVRARMAAYVTGFFLRFSNVVAVETYEQNARETFPVGQRRLVMSYKRALKSDVLLVRYPGAALDRMMFRDVGEVDGKPVHHQQDRLIRLFAEPAPDAAERAAAISSESARFHMSGASFAVTNPLLVVALMQPHYQSRLRFTLGGEERSLGRGVRLVRFEEAAAAAPPSGGGREAQPLLAPLGGVRGNVWVDAETGTILKTEARIGSPPAVAVSITTFGLDARLALTVPTEMRTTWTYVDAQKVSERPPVNGVATYSGFRRFDVRTDSSAVQPPRP